MTTLSIRSDDESPAECAPSSLAHDLKSFRVYGTDGSERHFTRPQASVAVNAGPCPIYFIDASHASSSISESFSDFDKLLQSVEVDPQAAASVQEGRKWVADSFYGDRSTLASLRLAAGLSQRQVAAACGIEQPHVSRYESGRHEPSLGTAQKMAAVLGVGLDVFAAAWANTVDDAST